MSAVMLALLLGSAPQQFLFGQQGGWLVVSATGEVQARFSELRGLRPIDLAMSSDGKRWAATDRLDGKLQLHLFERDDASVRTVPAPGTVLDGLSFASDGESVYLSANDSSATVPRGAVMNYAQVYRVRFATGRLERISNSRGCHMWPRPMRKGEVAFSHANCAGSRGASIVNERTGTETVLLANGIPNSTRDLAYDHSHDRLLVPQQTATTIELWEWAPSMRKRTRLWATRALTGERLRPQWVDEGRALLFQERGELLRANQDGSVVRVASIAGVEGGEK